MKSSASLLFCLSVKRLIWLFLLLTSCTSSSISTQSSPFPSGDVSQGESDGGNADISADVTPSPDTKTGSLASKGCGKAAIHPGGGVQVSFEAGADADGKRSFYLVIPKKYDPNKPHRLIIGYPGTNASGAQIRSYLKLEDGAANEIYVYPDPLKRQFKGWGTYGGWVLGPHAAPAHGNQDLNFTSELLDYINERYCIDTSRVFATGHSWGGDMAMVAACFLGDRFRAAAPSAANRPYWFEKSGGQAVSCKGDTAVWVFFGRADDHFKSQQFPGEYGDQCRDFWLKERQCSKPTATEPLPFDKPGACLAYSGCRTPLRYCLYESAAKHQNPSYFSASVRAWFRSF